MDAVFLLLNVVPSSMVCFFFLFSFFSKESYLWMSYSKVTICKNSLSQIHVKRENHLIMRNLKKVRIRKCRK